MLAAYGVMVAFTVAVLIAAFVAPRLTAPARKPKRAARRRA